MKIKNYNKFIWILILAPFLQACSLKPNAWIPQEKPLLKGELESNEKLQSSFKIALQHGVGPEDIVFDADGNLYCGVHMSKTDFSSGYILKISPHGEEEIYYHAKSWVAGLHFDGEGNLIALSHREGLISISPTKKMTVLANRDEKGNSFLIPNGLDIASNGTIYFSNTSSIQPYSVKYGKKLILELRPQGGLYQYNPKTKQVTTLIEGTYFGNGVVLSKNEDFILMTETSKYQIIKYGLKGEIKGHKEIWIDNLPGFPNGISRREDGTFWVGFSTLRNDALDKIHPKKGMKKFVYALPEFVQPKQQEFGMVLNIDQEGKILFGLFDTTGKFIPEAGAVKEHQGYLYIGGDIVPYIAKYKL